jgi:hypothetical protein
VDRLLEAAVEVLAYNRRVEVASEVVLLPLLLAVDRRLNNAVEALLPVVEALLLAVEALLLAVVFQLLVEAARL